MAPNGIAAEPAQRLVDPDRRHPPAGGLTSVACEQPIEIVA
jgi:hypothetical protein